VLPCRFLLNEFIGIHIELERGQALVVIITIVTAHGALLVKVDVGVGNPLIHLALLGNLEPSMAAWLELQQALFCVLMKPLFRPLMTIDVEQLFCCRGLVSKSAHPSPNCGHRRWLLCATV
jgi:hypothetical protein